MNHYHVLLTIQDAPEKTKCIFSDLSETELTDKFLRPYRRGKSFLCESEVIEISRIRSVRVVRTDRDSAAELKTIQEKSRREIEDFNRESTSIVLISAGRGYDAEDIAEAGADVTSSYISGPPGSGDRWSVISSLVNHPWVSAIGTGVVVAAVVWWLGWNE